MSSVHFSSKTLAQAAAIAEQIESLENQLSVLLQGGDSVAEKQSTPKAAPKRRVSVPKKADSGGAQGCRRRKGNLTASSGRHPEKEQKTFEDRGDI